MHCRDALIVISLFCLSLFTHLTSSLRFHGSCANFAGRGDVADDLATAARNAKQVAANAWDMRTGVPSIPTTLPKAKGSGSECHAHRDCQSR